MGPSDGKQYCYQRLYNARTLSLVMWKLLGVRPDKKLEGGGVNSDGKATPDVRVHSRKLTDYQNM